jgi:predicted nucleic acid-binding protein
LLLEEPDKPAIEHALQAYTSRLSSGLLRIELRRLGLLRGVLDRADYLLGRVSLIPLEEAVLETAETIAPATVRTLDAIHLATAVRLHEADKLSALMTYDKQLAAGASEHGITVLSPS